MLNDIVFSWLKNKGLEDRITEHEETIDTVEHAAMRIGCTEAEIDEIRKEVLNGCD